MGGEKWSHAVSTLTYVRMFVVAGEGADHQIEVPFLSPPLLGYSVDMLQRLNYTADQMRIRARGGPVRVSHAAEQALTKYGTTLSIPNTYLSTERRVSACIDPSEALVAP
jgi:hypothetical protein